MKFLRTLGFLVLILQDGKAYSIVQDNNNNKCQQLEHDESSSIHRRQFMTAFGTSATISTLFTCSPQVVRAFDGSGSSAYSGRSPATKAELKRQYRERVVADVRDFNALGDAIRNGETEGKAWVNFFIQFQRREPDSVGRTYAALVDLRGIRIKKEEFEGGDGMLLANTFTKSGKPPDNTPAVKSFKKLSPSFDAIEAAGKNGDAKQALAAWEKTKALLEAFLADVELPSSINDPIYK